MGKKKINKVYIAIIPVIIIVAVMAIAIAAANGGRVCGNSVCEVGESYLYCPSDCLETCGNGVCDSGEYANNCPMDCASPTVCGDGICEDTETEQNCPDDCTGIIPVISTICSNEDFANYISQHEGTSNDILSELDSYCFDNRPYDLDGCPMSQEKSTFDCSQSTCMADCVSICEWYDDGKPKSGHVLFEAIWLDTDPVMVMGVPRAGIFTVENDCSTGLLSILFGLPRVQFG